MNFQKNNMTLIEAQLSQKSVSLIIQSICIDLNQYV